MDQHLLISENHDDFDLDKKKENEKEVLVNKLGSRTLDIYLHASCFSKLFFYWAYKIIKLANKTSLNADYLGIQEKQNTSRVYYKDLENVWELKNYKQIKSNALLKASLRANICHLIYVFFLTGFCTSLEIITVYVFRIFIKLYQFDYIPPYDFFTKMNIGIALVILKLFTSFIWLQFNLYQDLLGFKATNQLNCMIYNKVLKIAPASNNQISTEGEIVNFLQVDATKLSQVFTHCPWLLIDPFKLCIYIYMLFEFIGIAFVFGLGILILVIIINACLLSYSTKIWKQFMARKDERMKVTTETLNNLKVLKFYGWEDEFLKRIENARNLELKCLNKSFNVTTVIFTLFTFAPVLIAVSSIGAYQYFNDQLRIEDIFSCLNIFQLISGTLVGFPSVFNSLLELIVSMKRVQKFLLQDEINNSQIIRDDLRTIQKGISIKIENGFYSWGKTEIEENVSDNKNTKESTISKNDEIDKNNKINSVISENSNLSDNNIITLNGENQNSKDPLIILKNLNLEINKGELICIIGEVGSGKSSLLHVILNNMIQINNANNILEQLNCKSTLIVNGNISYVSQTPWIQSDTIKNNILFYSPFDLERYNYVLDVCELRPDLKNLPGGDLTEIGEKGINLSGGQKARISIARAVYANNDIFIFDDPISALDAHVGKNIMNNLIVKNLSGKTRLLVTHAINYLSFADRIIYMEKGEIKWIGNYDQIFEQEFFINFKMKTNMITEKSDDININEKEKYDCIENERTNKLLKEEEMQKGEVKKEIFYNYFIYMGGWSNFLFVFFIVLIWQIFKATSDWWLAYWTKIQNVENNFTNFLIYSSLGFPTSILIFLKVYKLTRSSLKCSKRLHHEMIEKLIFAPINLYHDTVPRGQILNRLSNNLNTIDTWTSINLGWISNQMFSLIGSITICSIIEPFSLVFVPILLFLSYRIYKFYGNANRDLSRLESITRSPIINLLSETIGGAITIRSFNSSYIFSNNFNNRIDEYYKVIRFEYGCSNFFSMSLGFFSILFLIFLIIFSIVFQDYYTAQQIGLILVYSISLQDQINNLLNSLTTFENNMVSMERCLTYTNIQSENRRITDIDEELKKISWPTKGKIRFENYSVKYRPENDLVLKNLNFVIEAGEKIGIVGRTGSGKSTICLSLFRILEAFSGFIYIDEIDISKIGLKILRSSLTIIPQDPSLVEGTLKYNIDPLNNFSENEIVDVMKMIGFCYIINKDNKGLSQIIIENGNNLSVGEKQLVCITRAILRKSKIVIMDEATANIDIKTEEIIQNAINEVMKNSTIITIAHRIKTIINYDKILVLRDGEKVEYDSPSNLIASQNSHFYELYRNSNL